MVCLIDISKLSAEGDSDAGVYIQKGEIRAGWALGTLATVF